MTDSLPIGKILRRSVTVERDRLAKRAAGDERIPISISSEEPVDRFFGREVLVHTKDAINLDHAREGLPLLADHDGTRQIGLVEDVRLRKDGKLGGMLRQGNHPDAGWYFKDIESGIRSNISVGYQINEMEPGANDDSTFRAIRWTPMEVSTVAVPADITVGVGRSAELSNFRGQHMSNTEEHGRGPHAVTLGDREHEMTEIARLAREHGMDEHLAGWYQRGLSRNQVSDEILDRKKATAQPVDVPGYLGMSPRENARAMNSVGEMLICQADRRPLPGIWNEIDLTIGNRGVPTVRGGVRIPLDLQVRASVTGNIAGTSSLGGAGVQTSILSLIDLLRNQTQCVRLGARVLSGLTGNISFPRLLTANTLNWTGENPSSGNTNTAATLDNVTLSPKTAMGSTAFSRQILVQSSPDMQSLVVNDLTSIAAVGIDAAAINGSGSANQPTGIYQQTGVNTVTHTGANGGVPIWDELVSYETKVAQGNADDASMAWLTNPAVRGRLKTVLKSTTAGSTYLWDLDNTINGYRAAVSNNVPSNLTFGTSTTVCHGAIFGNWAELLIGEWSGAMEVLVDPYSVAAQNMIQTHVFVLVDIGVRHPASFTIAKGLKIA